MRKLSWQQATARLPRAKLLQVTSELCGLPAQVMSSAELTAWSRIEWLRAGDIGRIYGPQGWFFPVVPVNGRLDGVWRFDRQYKSWN